MFKRRGEIVEWWSAIAEDCGDPRRRGTWQIGLKARRGLFAIVIKSLCR
jgi:hypothetical protein